MLTCHDLEYTSWSPDFSSSGQRNPHWTKVTCAGVVLTTSLEWTEWAENPIQVFPCEECGHDGCEPGGYVHVSRLGDHVLWSRPLLDEDDEWGREEYTPPDSIREHGVLVFSREVWNGLHERRGRVPPQAALVPATRRVLADCWRASAPFRTERLDEMLPFLRERLDCGDSLAPDEALRLSSRLIEWLMEAPDAPVVGELRAPSTLGAVLETLQLDGGRGWRWPAFALRGDEPLLALSREVVFVPDTSLG
ncbi:MAG: hypothetical protein AAF533_26610 [Acidobacteriota bacterium]